MTTYVFKYIKYHISKALILTIIILFSSIVGILIPYLNGTFIDMLVDDPDMQKIIYLTVIICVFSIFNVSFSYFTNLILTKLNKKIEYEIVTDMIKHMQKIPYDVYIKKFNHSQLIQRITSDVQTIVSFFLSNIFQLFFNALIFIFLSVVLFSISKFVFLIVLLFIPIYSGIYILLKKPLF